jgi:hypothetical protein
MKIVGRTFDSSYHDNAYTDSASTTNIFAYGGTASTFATYKTNAGISEANSTHTKGSDPTGFRQFIYRNEFWRGAIVAIENWGLAASTTIDLRGLGLKTGDTVEIIRAENWPTALHTITYDESVPAQSSAVVVTTNDTTRVAPVGITAGLVPSTSPRFNAYLIRKCPCPW